MMRLENVLFLPPVPKSEMPAALAGADACIAILKPLDAYKTTYPNKVFDYMAAARPVVLAIDGVIREVVEISRLRDFCPTRGFEQIGRGDHYPSRKTKTNVEKWDWLGEVISSRNSTGQLLPGNCLS